MPSNSNTYWHPRKDLENKVCRAFQELRDKTHQSSEVLFDHFLEYVISGWAVNDRPLSWWKYDKEQTGLFRNLFFIWVNALKDTVDDTGWYDFLGVIYEKHVAGILRRKGAGQFFTPPHICDMMAKVTATDGESRESLSDPCCGSGRMILAAHANDTTIVFFAKDLDRTCAMMTVCNMLVHGCRGTVEWGDGLNPVDIRSSWEVNHLLGTDGPFGPVPHIRILK